MAAPEPPPVFARWMLPALVLGCAVGGAGLWGYLQHTARWERPAPKVANCFLGVRPRLRQPTTVTPTEPYPGPGDETVYLTMPQTKAAQCAGALTAGTDKRVAAAFAHTDPDEQGRALAALLTDLPADPASDRDAVGLWLIASAAFEGLPQSDAVKQARDAADQAVGCRVVSSRLPVCADKPALPVWVWLTGGAGSFAVCLVFASILQAGGARVGRKKGAPAAAPKAAPEAPAKAAPEEPAKPPKKKRKKAPEAASTAEPETNAPEA